MKKWNLLFLVWFIILTILIAIPIFQNVTVRSIMVFYGNRSALVTNVYMKVMFMGILDGMLLLLYVQSLLKDVKRQDATKFDLNK